MGLKSWLRTDLKGRVGILPAAEDGPDPLPYSPMFKRRNLDNAPAVSRNHPDRSLCGLFLQHAEASAPVKLHGIERAGTRMADDMSNNNDAHRVYADAITAELGEWVTNLGCRQTGLESEVRSGFKNIDCICSCIQ
ncbi:hypothetical protein FHT82_001134 [Rhizobium sp. BK275]|uniref:hypothetical protein n=1 Tax=unclassified Rhizobium TaxID=2613769 RepID=UPI0016076534|nr:MULTISPECIES: hypothetical protein [unclassified Rhizobium]MBB3388414.1 hypothetical protein [Rhizobium sp. BK275]MBB3407769.1 hypothetical protein [Rhizobium sp. BK316]